MAKKFPNSQVEDLQKNSKLPSYKFYYFTSLQFLHMDFDLGVLKSKVVTLEKNFPKWYHTFQLEMF
jgi:hypothetical protein